MEVRKREGSPFWMLDYVHPVTGRRTRTTTKVAVGPTPAAQRKSQRMAEAAGHELLASLEREAAEAKTGKPRITLRDALDAYTKNRKAAGKVSASRGMDALTKKTLGDIPASDRFRLDGGMWLSDLTARDLEALTQARASEGNGPQTIAHELKHLRAAHTLARGLGYRVSEVSDWRLPSVPKKTRYLSWEEWGRLYAYLDPDKPITQRRGAHKSADYAPHPSVRAMRQEVQDLVLALTLCGGRWSEVAALTWSQIDVVTWASITIYGTKSGGKERMVGLPAQLADALRRRYEARTGLLVFPGRDGRGTRNGAPRSIARALDATGCNEPGIVARHGRATAHSLRHTYASWLLQRDAGLAEVQDALGHATLHMTLRYAHLSKAKTAAKLGGLLTDMMQGDAPA